MKGMELPSSTLVKLFIFIVIVLLAYLIINYIFSSTAGEARQYEEAFSTACLVWSTKNCKQDEMSFLVKMEKGTAYCCDKRSCDESCVPSAGSCSTGKFEINCVSLKEICDKLENGDWEKCKKNCFGCPKE